MDTENDFPFVEVPKALRKKGDMSLECGRWWVERGPVQFFHHWLSNMHETFPNDLIPLQWVPEFVQVTRAAVHKRAKAGKLTVCSFIIAEPRRTLLHGLVDRETRRRYDYAFLTECNFWHDLLLDRANDEFNKRFKEGRR